MNRLKGGLVGCGFYSRNHLEGWREVAGAEIIALCDSDRAKANAMMPEFGSASTYADMEEMLARETLDFVDIVTPPDSHLQLVELAAAHGVPVICQKPMAPGMAAARQMVAATAQAGVPFMVHENFRWRPSVRALRAALDKTGPPFFARISFRSGHDVFAAQPYLAREERFILSDLGVHLCDLARFLMGEMRWLVCRAQRINPKIAGEDVATVLMENESGATCLIEASYASHVERELFPQILITVESPHGAVTLGPDHVVTTVDACGVEARDHSATARSWTRPGFEATAHSIVALQSHWVRCLGEGSDPETTGSDNLKTLELVHAAYESAESGQALVLEHSRQ